MSNEKKVLYEELRTGTFFEGAISKAQSALMTVKGVLPNERRTSGSTAIQAFIGHKELIMSATSGSEDSTNDIISLYQNTNEFLKNIGENFAGIDADIASEIAK